MAHGCGNRDGRELAERLPQLPYLARHELVGNYVYELPFGHGHHFAMHGAADQVLDGWSISGITTYETGPPFTVTFTPPGTYPGWVSSRADVVPGVNPYMKNQAIPRRRRGSTPRRL